MDRDPNSQPVDILYIGQLDSSHEKLWEQLPREGISVRFARTQKSGLELAAQAQPQIVVINLTDAQFSGTRLCQALRRRLPRARRLLITDRSTTLSNIPCDLRLVRPFTARKLRETLFKLLEEAAPHIIRTGRLQLDIVSRMVTAFKGQERLTPKQCKLLSVFMQHPNQVISRKDLMDQIWETAYLGDTRTLDVHIRWLRERIELDPMNPTLLQTRRGVGYVLVIPELEAPQEDSSDGD